MLTASLQSNWENNNGSSSSQQRSSRQKNRYSSGNTLQYPLQFSSAEGNHHLNEIGQGLSGGKSLFATQNPYSSSLNNIGTSNNNYSELPNLKLPQVINILVFVLT